MLEKGNLKIGIFYEGAEIVSMETAIGGSEGGEVSSESEISEIQTPETQTETQQETELELGPILNETQNKTQTEIPIQELELTDEETTTLIRQFGNISLEVKSEKTKNGFIIIRYELGDYWINYSYSSDLDNNTLNIFIQQDKIKWLKDLAEKYSA